MGSAPSTSGRASRQNQMSWCSTYSVVTRSVAAAAFMRVWSEVLPHGPSEDNDRRPRLYFREMSSQSAFTAVSPAQARDVLDAQVREVVAWHFDPATGCPFWLDFAKNLGWDPRTEIKGFADLKRLGPFEDEWLRGGPVQRWVPRGLAGKPVFVF